MKAYIQAMANYLPERILDNHELEKTLDTNNEWIITRTGIEQRHIADRYETAFSMAMQAINVLKNKNISFSNVEAIIVPTTTKEHLFPSTASLIQNALGIKNCMSMDISCACSGYIYAVNTATVLIESGKCRNVLIVATENMTKDVDWNDRSTAILFGDAAHVCLMGAREDEKKEVIFMDMGVEPRDDILAIKSSGSANPISEENIDKKFDKIYMEGAEVFKVAVTHFKETILKTLEKAKISISDISVFVPHQANLRIIKSLAREMSIPMEKILLVINKCGNTSATSIGLTLSNAVDDGKIKEGDNILLAAFGAGLTWGATIIRWC